MREIQVKLNKLLTNRFNDLASDAERIEATKYDLNIDGDYPDYYIDYEIFLNWKVKVQDLLSKVCGVESYYFQEFEKFLQDRNDTHLYVFKSLKSIFLAAKDDFENGYLISIRMLIQAEVFDSELEQAKELLEKGYYQAAAIITGVILETTLRELCHKHKVQVAASDTINKMNESLGKANIYEKLTQKRITSLADIRNNAAHGNIDKFKAQDVSQMFTEVQQFLAEHMK
jgi:hypothetical protein